MSGDHSEKDSTRITPLEAMEGIANQPWVRKLAEMQDRVLTHISPETKDSLERMATNADRLETAIGPGLLKALDAYGLKHEPSSETKKAVEAGDPKALKRIRRETRTRLKDGLASLTSRRVRAAARQAGIKDSHMPDRCGIPKKTYYRIAKGETAPSAVDLVCIAKATGVDPNWLLGFR